MQMTCGYCGKVWDTTGDIHGEAACRTYMRDQLAAWKKGVADANAISQRYEGEAQRLRGVVKALEDRLHDTESEFKFADKRHGERYNEQIARIADLERQLHQARAEWSEEKKRAMECEENEARLRGVIEFESKARWEAVRERDENMAALQVERRRCDTVEDEYLYPLYDALLEYFGSQGTKWEEEFRIKMNEVFDKVDVYVARRRGT